MRFTAFGHELVQGKHKTTLEFTKDEYLTENGDCILGINADFDPTQAKRLKGNVRIKLFVDNLSDELSGYVNPDFNDNNSMVIRKSNYLDSRTFATNASKSAKDINRDIIVKLQNPKQEIIVVVENA